MRTTAIVAQECKIARTAARKAFGQALFYTAHYKYTRLYNFYKLI